MLNRFIAGKDKSRLQIGRNLHSASVPYCDLTEKELKAALSTLAQKGDSVDIPVHSDTAPGPGWHSMITSLEGWIAQYFGDETGKTAPAHVMMGLGKTSDNVHDFVVKEWNKATNSVFGIAFDTSQAWWGPMRQGWINDNFKLIRGAAKRYIGEVNRLAEKAVVNGWSYKDLTKDFESLGNGLGHNYARLLARDQIGKLNGTITQGEQTDAGLETYIWQTAGDERVRGKPGGLYPDADPSHWLMEGLLCRWDDATVCSYDGGKTWVDRPDGAPLEHPGMDIQCRCTAIASFDEITSIVDEALAREEE